MSTRGRLLFEVAMWEFHRWYKMRDQLITLVLSVVVGLAVFGGTALINRDRSQPVDVVAIGLATMPFSLPGDGRVRIVDAGARAPQELRDAVAAEEIDGLLTIASTTDATLLVRHEPRWLPELETAMTQARRSSALAELQVSEVDLAGALAPYRIGVEYHPNAAGPTSRAARLTAVTIVSLMIVGVVIGLGLQFVAITGEKQLRVTEQVVSAISPQTWIDGKILGVSMVALVTLGTYLLGIVIFLGMSWVFGRDIPIPVGVVGPGVWMVLIPVALGGFLFWNTFFAAVAATIDDPNTSARGSLIMLPAVPLIFAMLKLGNPDTVLTQIFAIVPVTAHAFLPLRLMLAQVPWWEIAASVGMLFGGAALMRRMAGKIFGVGILTYGKEPSLSEMLRWSRSA